MTIIYQGRSYLGFQEYIDDQLRRRPHGPDATPAYAHPIDRWILRTLNAAPVRAGLSQAIDALVSFEFSTRITESVTVDQRSFPDLFDALSHCARTLGIPLPHAVARHDQDLFNAFTVGTDEYAFISLSSTLCQVYSREEAGFVIGHECGHIAAGHMLYHNLAQKLADATTQFLLPLRLVVGPALFAWSRRSEITADRAGLLCCGSLAVAERALLRTVTGFVDIERVDIDDYLRHSHTLQKEHPSYRLFQLFQQHPILPKRIEALRLFARSELYYDLAGLPPPASTELLSLDTLNRLVDRMVEP